MSKLIYSALSAQLEQSLPGVYLPSSIDTTLEGYKSIAFTGDGYVYTHGQKFRIYKVVNNTVTGLLLTWATSNGNLLLQDGDTIFSNVPVVSSITGDSIISATPGTGTNAKDYTITHSLPNGLTTNTTYGGGTNTENNVSIPVLTIDSYGHIITIQNSTLNATKVKASSISDSNKYSIIAVNGDSILEPKYVSNILIDKDGNIYEGGTALSLKYASTAKATDVLYGIVKLSDATDSNLNAAQGLTAATPLAVKNAITTANQFAKDLFSSNDALVFIGTIDNSGKFKSHNNNILPEVINNTSKITEIDYKAGYTAKAIEAGSIVIGTGNDAVTFPVEVGDMLVCLSDKGSTVKGSDFTVIQNNIDGAVTSSNLLNGLLIGTNSRDISSVAFPQSGSKFLKGDSLGISWENYSAMWRTFYQGSTTGNTISNKDIIMIASTGNGTTDPLTIVFDNSGDLAKITYTLHPKAIASSAIKNLKLEQNSTIFTYSPTSDNDLSLLIGAGLKLTSNNNVYTLDHPTVSSSVNNKLGKITTDSYGHVSGFDEVTSLKNPNALYIAVSGTVKSNGTYDGSEVIGYNFKGGSDVTISSTDMTTSTGFTYSGVNKAKGLDLTFSITHKYRPIDIQTKVNGSYSTTNVLVNTNDGTLTLKEGDNIGLSNSSGVVTISAVDTWRPITLYTTSNNHTRIALAAILDGSSLVFNSDLVVDDGELGICWTEIDALGNITYTN